MLELTGLMGQDGLRRKLHERDRRSGYDASMNGKCWNPVPWWCVKG